MEIDRNESETWLQRAKRHVLAGQVFYVGALLTVAGSVALFFGVYSPENSSIRVDVVHLGAGLVLLFAATIHRFELLKGLGMEARTRTLDQKIDQAESALAKLNQLTILTGTQLLELRYFKNSPTTAVSAEGYAGMAKIKQLLERAGATGEVLRGALTPWITAAARELFLHRVFEMGTVLHQTCTDLEDRKKASQQAPEIERLGQRIKLLRSLDTMTLPMRANNWDLATVQQEILKLEPIAKAFSEEQPHRLETELRKAVEELDHLIRMWDFNDKKFWHAQSSVRE